MAQVYLLPPNIKYLQFGRFLKNGKVEFDSINKLYLYTKFLDFLLWVFLLTLPYFLLESFFGLKSPLFTVAYAINMQYPCNSATPQTSSALSILLDGTIAIGFLSKNQVLYI